MRRLGSLGARVFRSPRDERYFGEIVGLRLAGATVRRNGITQHSLPNKLAHRAHPPFRPTQDCGLELSRGPFRMRREQACREVCGPSGNLQSQQTRVWV